MVYMSNDIEIHRTKLENADALYENHVGGRLTPPSAESVENLPPFVRHEFSIKNQKTDIVISGLGWITIQHPGVVAVYVPKGVDVVLRPSLFKEG